MPDSLLNPYYEEKPAGRQDTRKDARNSQQGGRPRPTGMAGGTPTWSSLCPFLPLRDESDSEGCLGSECLPEFFLAHGAPSSHHRNPPAGGLQGEEDLPDGSPPTPW